MQDLNKNGKPIIDEKYLRPSNAESLMCSAQNAKQTVYISGAAGNGKTSFVADFLKSKEYEYYSTENIDKLLLGLKNVIKHKRDNKENIIVVDDLQFINTQDVKDSLYDILYDLTGMDNVWLILISRADIPSWIKPLYIKRIFVRIKENHLFFTKKEQRTYVEKWNLKPMQATLDELWEKGKGYPLFLRIFAMKLLSHTQDSLGLKETKSSEMRKKVEIELVKQSLEDFSDYIRVCVYEQWDIELQEFLMDISIVEFFDVGMAQLITKRNDAEKMILNAMEMGNFIKKIIYNNNIYYEFREEFKITMRRQLNLKANSTHIEELYYSAGMGYELGGDVVNALNMYEKCGREDGISRLLVANVRKYAGNGHYWELRRYYLELSEDIIRESPELMTGMSLLQSILMNDEESERWYQELKRFAKENSGSAKKVAQARIMYLDIALPHRGTISMIDILKNVGAFIKERREVLPEFSLTNNQPSIMNGGKDFCHWSKREKEVEKSIGKITEYILGSFGKGLINLTLAESHFEKGMDNYEVSNMANQGRIQAESGGKLEQVFVAVGILSQLSLINNRVDDGLEMLDNLEDTAVKDAPQIVNGIKTLRTRFLLYKGKSSEIEEWMETAPKEDKEFCTLERYRYMTKARVYLMEGKNEKAVSLLQRMITYANKRQRVFIRIEANILLAIAQYRIHSNLYRKALQLAISEAEEYHFVRVISREGTALIDIINDDNFIWKDKEYKKQVINECRKMADNYPEYLTIKSNEIFLSEKALQILRMQADGLSINKIAEKMELTPAGIKYYNSDTYKKIRSYRKNCGNC